MKTILVAGSAGRNQTLELIWKVLHAFKDIKKYRIMLKFHPDVPYSSISKQITKFGKLPNHISVTQKPVSELLKQTDLLIYSTTTVAFEAIALGVPALHIQSDFMIDIDPLDVEGEK